MTGQNERTPIALLLDAVGQVLRLLKGELALAQVEVQAGLRVAVTGLVMLVVAVILAVTAVDVLAGVLVLGLIEAGLAPVWAALLVGITLLVIAGILVRFGLKAVQPSTLVPARALRSMQRDMDALREGLSS